jgi:hypothetical protein
MKENFLCPVCGKYTFEEYGDYDICHECGWENDAVQGADFNYRGGANSLSVNDYKIIYKLSLCNEMSDRLAVLKRDYRDKCGDIYAKYPHINWSIDGDKVTQEFNNADNEYMSKIYELYENICKKQE